jgi:hypothetical protein
VRPETAKALSAFPQLRAPLLGGAKEIRTPDLLHAMHCSFVGGGLAGSGLCRSSLKERAGVKLGRQVADAAQRGFISHLRSAAVVFHGVPEPVDVLSVDLAAQQFVTASGSSSRLRTEKSRSVENRPALPAYSLRSAVPPLKTR